MLTFLYKNSIEPIATSPQLSSPQSKIHVTLIESTETAQLAGMNTCSSGDHTSNAAAKTPSQLGSIFSHQHYAVPIKLPPAKLAYAQGKKSVLIAKVASSLKAHDQMLARTASEDSETHAVVSEEMEASSIAASSNKCTSSDPLWCLRYATREEAQQFIRSIDDEKYEMRLKGSYEMPRTPEDCFADESWLPYQCFVCNQTRDMWKGIKTHLRLRHSIIIEEKVQAWDCFYPGCSKRFSSRPKGMKHALQEHWPGMTSPYQGREYGRVTANGRVSRRNEGSDKYGSPTKEHGKKIRRDKD